MILNGQYDYISMDITSNCNLRCPFCFNDYKKLPANINMTKESFSKIIELLPLAPKEKFLFSCGFEPALNPDFVPLLKMIPAGQKSKIFFTTNLSIKQSEQFFDALAQSNVAVMNISLDSLNPVTYEILRNGAKFDYFINNLEALAAAFRKVLNPPKIRFTTMVFKQNIGELLNVAYACHSRYFAFEHEFRTPFYDTYINMNPDWAKKSIISGLEWDDLVENLNKLNYNLKFEIPPFPYIPEIVKNINSVYLRINSDGSVYNEEGFICNINDIEEPYNYFKNKLLEKRKILRNEIIGNSVHKPKEKIEKFINENQDKRICFWGAGELAEELIKTYDFSKLNLIGFIDSNISKKGQNIGNYKIYSREDIISLSPDVIVLSVYNHNSAGAKVQQDLNKLGVKAKLITDLFHQE